MVRGLPAGFPVFFKLIRIVAGSGSCRAGVPARPELFQSLVLPEDHDRRCRNRDDRVADDPVRELAGRAAAGKDAPAGVGCRMDEDGCNPKRDQRGHTRAQKKEGRPLVHGVRVHGLYQLMQYFRFIWCVRCPVEAVCRENSFPGHGVV